MSHTSMEGTPASSTQDNLDAISRSLALTDRALREFFPDNYWKRCMYAAFGLQLLLEHEGIGCDIVAGDMLCVVRKRRGGAPYMDGYKSPIPGRPAHFWVETTDAILDMGPYYLPKEAREPIADLPFVRWLKRAGLPNFLRYRELVRCPRGTPIQLDDPVVMDQLGRFLPYCRSLPHQAPPQCVTWELSDIDSARAMSQRGDLWANTALRFDAWVDPAKLPF